MAKIYFDNHSTTFADPKVADEVHQAILAGHANPASQHELGRQARLQLENYREVLAGTLGLSRRDRCLFTSGGTESNNLGILGHFPAYLDFSGSNIVSSAIEHPSVYSTFEELEKRNIEIRWVNPDSDGTIDPYEFERHLDDNTRLACCMMANNETGVIQPVMQIASICSRRSIPFHVDAVQAVGKTEFDFSKIGCSSASISAHKIHGPIGVGLLILQPDCRLSPLTFGGFQQEGIRPGTENIPLAAGLTKSILLAVDNLSTNLSYIAELRDHFESRLLESDIAIQIHGAKATRLCNSSNISFKGCDRQQFILAADVAGLCCSTGSACSSGSSQPSHVLTAMGCERELVESAIRFGFSRMNSMDEVDSAVEIICGILGNKKLSF